MRKALLAMPAVAILALLAALPGAAGDPPEGFVVRRFHEEIPSEGLAAVRLEAPLGELRVIGSSRETARLSMVLECHGEMAECRGAAERVSWQRLQEGERLGVLVTGPETFSKRPMRWVFGGSATGYNAITGKKRSRRSLPREIKIGSDWQLIPAFKLLYPMAVPLEIELAEGRVEVRGLRVDAALHLGRGAVRIEMLKVDAATVELATGEGKVTLRAPGAHDREGTSVSWDEGGGTVHLKVRLEEGDALVTLR